MTNWFSYFAASVLAIGASIGGMESPDKEPSRCCLPPEFHIKNSGGSDGAGLCVFASIDHAAKWQGVKEIEGIFEWMKKHPGGGWPEKVDKMIEKICREREVEKPPYVQIEGGDLEVIKKACRSGRMPSVTYCWSPTGRYNGQKIAHMVSIVEANDKWIGVLDNNYPKTIEWMTPKEFEKCYTGYSGQGWCVILLPHGPPPRPRN